MSLDRSHLVSILMCLVAACAPSKPPSSSSTTSAAQGGDGGVPADAEASSAIDSSANVIPANHDEAIEHALAAANPKLEACRTAGLKRESRLSGHVRVKLHVDAHGAVTQVEDLGSKVNDGETLACFVAALKALTLPADNEAYEVVKSYTILPPPDVWPAKHP
jgi:hypothetical protein